MLLMNLLLHCAGRLGLLLRSSSLRGGYSLVRMRTEGLVVELGCVCGF